MFTFWLDTNLSSETADKILTAWVNVAHLYGALSLFNTLRIKLSHSSFWMTLNVFEYLRNSFETMRFENSHTKHELILVLNHPASCWSPERRFGMIPLIVVSLLLFLSLCQSHSWAMCLSQTEITRLSLCFLWTQRNHLSRLAQLISIQQPEHVLEQRRNDKRRRKEMAGCGGTHVSELSASSTDCTGR